MDLTPGSDPLIERSVDFSYYADETRFVRAAYLDPGHSGAYRTFVARDSVAQTSSTLDINPSRYLAEWNPAFGGVLQFSGDCQQTADRVVVGKRSFEWVGDGVIGQRGGWISPLGDFDADSPLDLSSIYDRVATADTP